MWVFIEVHSDHHDSVVHAQHVNELCKEASAKNKILLQTTMMTTVPPDYFDNLGCPVVHVDSYQPDPEREPYKPTNLFEKCWVASEKIGLENSEPIICISSGFYHLTADPIAKVSRATADLFGSQKAHVMIAAARHNTVEDVGRTQVFLDKSDYAMWYMVNESIVSNVPRADLGVYGFHKSFLQRYWQSESEVEQNYLNVPMVRCLENGLHILYKIINT